MSQLSGGPGTDDESLDADAEALIERHAPEGEILERDVSLLEGIEVKARPLVRHGTVVEEILAEALEGDYDLIVIGAHVGTGWRKILLDDLAHEIIVRSDRPVLVVR
jgi:nucleotide-binding universal stress UspA family protein